MPIFSRLLLSTIACFSLEEEEKEKSFISSQIFNVNLCTVGPCIDFPSHLLSDRPADRMCADTWPAVTPLTPWTVNTDRLHAGSPSGPGAWSVVWLLTHPDFSQTLDPLSLGRWTWGMWKMSEVKSSTAGSPSPTPPLFLTRVPGLRWNGWDYKMMHGSPSLCFPGLSHSGLQSAFEGPSAVMCSLRVKVIRRPPLEWHWGC